MRSPYRSLLALCIVATRTVAVPAQDSPPPLHVATHTGELVIDYGPITLPANANHSQIHQPPPVVFTLPVDGWVRGFVVELVGGAGRRVPPGVLHHMNVIAKNRRDLFSNVMLRMGAVGPETRAIRLPRFLGVRVHPTDTLVMTLMFHNPTHAAYDGVRLRVHLPFTPASSYIGAVTVYPFSIAIGPKERPNVFDLPPGRSEHYWEGSPGAPVRILGVSGHLHRYGVALRLEDRTTGDVLWEVHPKADSTGEVVAMPVKLFLWTMGKPMRPDHVYRLTAVYENPEPRTIPDGGMAVLAGIVMLSRGARWPAVDSHHPEYVVDVRTIVDAPNWPSQCSPGGHSHASSTPPEAPPPGPHAPHTALGCRSPAARP